MSQPIGERSTPEQARDVAREVITAKAKGKDPQAERRASKQRYASTQFADVLDRFIAQHVRQTRSADETERILRKEFGFVWGRRSILDIRQPEQEPFLKPRWRCANKRGGGRKGGIWRLPTAGPAARVSRARAVALPSCALFRAQGAR